MPQSTSFIEMSRWNSLITSTIRRHASQACKTISNRKKEYWYLGISRITASGIITRLEYVFTCFVAHINADSSNKQTDNIQTLYIWKSLTEFLPISLKFETVLFFNFTTFE